MSDQRHNQNGNRHSALSLNYNAEIITVRTPREIDTKQALPYFVGISQTTVGAAEIAMNMVVIPPGASAKPHYHKDFETAIYMLKGRVETRYGKGLQKSVVNEAGEFIYIPAGLPHQPINLSSTETAMAIVSRNDPNEQENVVPYDV